MEGIIADFEEAKMERTIIRNAIPDLLGYGYEGRVRAEVEASVVHCSMKGEAVPAAIQRDWFLSHGYYTSEELMARPEIVKSAGRPKKSDCHEEEVKGFERMITRWKELELLLGKEKLLVARKRMT